MTFFESPGFEEVQLKKRVFLISDGVKGFDRECGTRGRVMEFAHRSVVSVVDGVYPVFESRFRRLPALQEGSNTK